MPPQIRSAKAQKEAKVRLARQAYEKGQISSIRKAAKIYNVPHKTLDDRIHGRVARINLRAHNRKLTQTEEQTLVEWILDMDARGYPLRIDAVREAALLLLKERVGDSAYIGINWPHNFVNNHDEIKSMYTRKYDYQRARCEDPAITQSWFNLVGNTKRKYGIADEDSYNFDETGFAMGIASTSRVVTSSDRRGRPRQIQPGDREWATAIETINAFGWCLPPMVILKGKVHLSTWYRTTDLPPEWVIALSENGWTNNELGMKWLQDVFDKYTAPRTIGTYRLLILDGHGSHATPKFDKFCSERSIITLCMPAHSSHLLQPLDVGCFSTLKRSYGRLVADQIRLGINHIDKAEFLPIFKQARAEALSKGNILSGFAAAGLIPFGPDRVLSKLQIRIHNTPPPPEPIQAPWHPETPHNVAQLEQQVEVIKGYLKRRTQSPPTPTDAALNRLVKGCQMAMHSVVLLASENEKLRAANERQKRRKAAKRSQISKETTLTVAEAQELIQQPEVAPNLPTSTVVTQLRSSVLPSCMKCYASDHKTRSCHRPH